VLLGTAAIVFIIACSNAANLILARLVRRKGELAVRAAATVAATATVLIGAAALASLMPAARASRIDVLDALRSE
jgi:ABC-type lipoprotein release transport system permease subunit